MHTWCIPNADLRRHHADIMQTSIQVCIWHTFLFSYAKHAQGKYADLIHTLCRLVKTLCRLCADYYTTYTSVHLTQCFVIIRQVLHGNFLTKLCFLQDLPGVKGTAPCWLIPGASTGREPEDQGQFGRYSPVQYLEEGSEASQDGRERELFPLGKCDDDGRPGTGSKLYYISSWAMCWPTDHPKRPVTGWVKCAPSLQSLHLAHLMHTFWTDCGNKCILYADYTNTWWRLYACRLGAD
jgi:hypothetical protein